MANQESADAQIASQNLKDAHKNRQGAIDAAIARSFGVSSLGIGARKTIDPTSMLDGMILIEYQWIAEIRHWWSRPVIIAYTKFKGDERDSRKGVLLTFSDYFRFEFLGTNPFRSVNIGDYPDIVAKALEQMNLFEPSIGVVPGDDRNPEITMSIHIGNGSRELVYVGGNVVDPSWLNLWDALYKTVKLLQAKYNDPEMDKLVNRSPAGVPALGLERYVTR